ncbi:MAG: asparagine synthase-related protein [Pyrinomonadaceae bacterium]
MDRASMSVSLKCARHFSTVEWLNMLPGCRPIINCAGETPNTSSNKPPPLLPAFVTKRRKKGFGVPVAAWLKERLRPLARDLLAPARLRDGGLFDPDYVAECLMSMSEASPITANFFGCRLSLSSGANNFYQMLDTEIGYWE